MGITSLIPGVGQAKLIGLGVGALLTFGAGFGAAEFMERKLPWGTGVRLERLKNSLPERDRVVYSKGAADQRTRDEDIVQRTWVPRLAQCEADRLAASQTAAQSIENVKDDARLSSNAAYRLGRASCGGSNAKTGSGTGTQPGSVRGAEDDLRNIVAGGLGRTP